MDGAAAHADAAGGRVRQLSDIFAGQPEDPEKLAALYDLEHDAERGDVTFYRELARRARGSILDLGCGSGRLLRPLVDGAPRRRVVGLDGSAALLARATRRIEADAGLRAARDAGRLELVRADVRRIDLRERFSLIVAVGVLPHLSGPSDAEAMLCSARRRLTARGRLVVDLPGPGALPTSDLPLGVDWERRFDGRRVVRRSRLTWRRARDGLHVVLTTMTEMERSDGTFARLPAAFRLWYPTVRHLEQIVARAGLSVSLVYGSHELDPLSRRSERLIVVAERDAKGGSG